MKYGDKGESRFKNERKLKISENGVIGVRSSSQKWGQERWCTQREGGDEGKGEGKKKRAVLHLIKKDRWRKESQQTERKVGTKEEAGRSAGIS